MNTPKTDEARRTSGDSNKPAWDLARELESENARLREGIESIINTRLKPYTDRQYGKGELRKLLS